jgi:hypothetical protein
LSAKPEPTGLLSSAARAAALAGCGVGQDAGELDEPERRRWRKQALDWLRADLASWDQALQRDTPLVQEAARNYLELRHRDSALAGLQDPAALAKLPEEERAAWQKFWSDAAALLRRAQQQEQP